MIEIKGLNKRFSQKEAVKDVSFQIKEGEIFALLGPNGAGKTTTMRMLSTLLKPGKGSIIMNGMDTCKDEKKIKEHIGFLTNEIRLDGQFTPDELADFYGELYHLERRELEKNKKELFDYFGITSISNKKYETFSTGMKQKTSIAICLIHNPDIIIFDEPTNGLDILTQKQVEDYLLMQKERGKTIIVSTHILGVVEKLADSVGIIIDGRTVAHGTIETIVDREGVANLEEAFLQLYRNNHTEESMDVKPKKFQFKLRELKL